MTSKPPNKKTDASPSGSGAPADSENVVSTSASAIPQPGAATRVIANITKIGAESTARGGGPRLKFTPNMPARRKKPEGEAKVEASTPRPLAPFSERGKGAPGGGAPRGGGRGSGPPRNEAPMNASGPFAMGPAATAASGRRGPLAPSSFGRLATSEKSGLGLTGDSAPGLPRNRDALAMEEDAEIYSDGEEVVDLGDVKVLDVMAPDALKKERRREKKKKVRVKEDTKADVKGKGKAAESMNVDIEEGANFAQALDLSESEEENELENLQEDFITGSGLDDLDDARTRMYLFQFPAPFPTFVRPAPSEEPKPESPRGKRVTFAEDVKEGRDDQSSSGPVKKEKEDPGPLEGIIGHLEILASGAVRMRLGNDMTFDVSAATQPSFLQQAVVLDKQQGTLNVLGSVQRRFVVSPDLDALLADVEAVEMQAKARAEEEASTMDVL